RACPRTHDPAGRRAREEERRERDDENQPGEDEAGATDERARTASEPPAAVDRELRRGGAREEVAGRDRVLELPRLQPATPLHAEAAQESAMRGWAAEADADDPP